jgi:NAD-dependent deacetylase
MDTEQIRTAAEWLSEAQHIACLTGAGVSAESGVATFRDAETGYWSQFDPEQLASQTGFARDPGLVWRWYMDRLLRVSERAAPNPGHVALADLEKRTPRFTLITQNVDDLHEQAGSENVYHLHGNIHRFRCNACAAAYELQPDDRTAELPPVCLACGGPIRPDVIWFGEMLPSEVLKTAWAAAESCDVMLVVGTSGIVYPAAQLPHIARQNGARVIDVNPDPNAIADIADLFLQGPSGEVLPQIVWAMDD